MEIKKQWDKLNPKVAMIGGAIVITTSLGTCQLTRNEQEVPVVEETVVEPVAEESEEEAEEGAEGAEGAPEEPIIE